MVYIADDRKKEELLSVKPIIIPEKIKKAGFRFILLGRKEKSPFEKAWSILPYEYTKQEDSTWKHNLTGEVYHVTGRDATNKEIRIPYKGEIVNYGGDEEKFLKHLGLGYNYGIIGGNYGISGNPSFLFLDFDDMDAYEKLKDMLPKTLTVKTGSGKVHAYYKSPDIEKSFKVIDIEKKNNY
ncbi:MAG: bifunctional DNA primase/polymerase [archaeon]